MCICTTLAMWVRLSWFFRYSISSNDVMQVNSVQMSKNGFECWNHSSRYFRLFPSQNQFHFWQHHFTFVLYQKSLACMHSIAVDLCFNSKNQRQRWIVVNMMIVILLYRFSSLLFAAAVVAAANSESSRSHNYLNAISMFNFYCILIQLLDVDFASCALFVEIAAIRRHRRRHTIVPFSNSLNGKYSLQCWNDDAFFHFISFIFICHKEKQQQ